MRDKEFEIVLDSVPERYVAYVVEKGSQACQYRCLGHYLVTILGLKVTEVVINRVRSIPMRDGGIEEILSRAERAESV